MIVDRRETVVDDRGDADMDDVGEFNMANSGGMAEGSADKGDSLNIYSAERTPGINAVDVTRVADH